MAVKISLGQYISGDSWLHHLDPRSKLCCGLIFVIAAFTVFTLEQLLLALIATATILTSSKISPRAIFRSIRPALALLAILGLFNLFFIKTGTVLFTLGSVHITSQGVWEAILYPTRFAIALVVGSLTTCTTTPTAIADAFDSLLSPLSRIGLPGHEIAMVLALMLRFIPTLVDDVQTISEAQESRGAALSSGKLGLRIQALTALLVAVFASALRHANNLSRALDARCYEGNAKRTHLHPLRFQHRDLICAILTCSFVVALICLA